MKNILVIGINNSWKDVIFNDLQTAGFNPTEPDSLQEASVDLVITAAAGEKASELNDLPEGVPTIIVHNISDIVDHESADVNKEFLNFPYEKADLISKVNVLIKRNDILKAYGTRTNVEKNLIKDTNNILLLDDDSKLLKLFEYNLSRAGFNVKTATNGEEALELLKTYIPDIIISDIMMPVMDGYRFRQEILKEPRLKVIPFVFLTAKGDETDILEGYNLEIEDYIIKTAGPRILVAKVTAILKSLDKERKKMISEIQQAADTLRAKVVPDSFPVFEGFDINFWHQPYKGIPGGDFIDYFMLDDDNLAIIIGDVMGKKWGAWYFAFAYAGYVRSAIRVVLQSSQELTSASILQKVNESIYQDAKVSEVFATLSILLINKKNKTAQYSGAGDFPVIYKNSQAKEIVELHSKGLLLGFSFDGDYSEVNVELGKDDILFLTTDGLIESRNSSGESFGSDRLKMLLNNLSGQPDYFALLKEQMQAFSASNFEDDLSIVCIRCL